MWGILSRDGGSEEYDAAPRTIPLCETECFVGRFVEPVNQGDFKFTHSSQIKIECPFVSSTHFSVAIKISDSVRTYFVTDHSRNGTFINGEHVGQRKTKELKSGDKLALMYKNKVRIQYSFSSVDVDIPASDDNKSIVSTKLLEEPAPLASAPSMKSQVESVTENLTKQIELLQDENRILDQRIHQQGSRIEATALDLERANNKIASLEKSSELRQEEKADLAERLSTAEANAAAVEARNCKLQEQLDSSKNELKELKIRTASLAEDLQNKTAQLASRDSIVESSNKTMANERNKWTKLEAKFESVSAALKLAEEQNSRYSTANQALQAVVSDQEATINLLRHRNEHLVKTIEAARVAVQDRESAIREVQDLLVASVANLQAVQRTGSDLLQNTHYFEKITEGVTGLKYNSIGDDMNGDPETYVEGPQFNGKFPAGEVLMAQHSSCGGSGAGVVAVKYHLSVSSDSDSLPGVSSKDHVKGCAATPTATASPAAAGIKRKRCLESDVLSSPSGSSKLQATGRTPTATATTQQQESGGNGEISDINHNDEDNEEKRVGDESCEREGEEEDEEEDMQLTQAPATFAHLFEDISQHSHIDSDSEGEVERDGDNKKADAIEKTVHNTTTAAAGEGGEILLDSGKPELSAASNGRSYSSQQLQDRHQSEFIVRSSSTPASIDSRSRIGHHHHQQQQQQHQQQQDISTSRCDDVMGGSVSDGDCTGVGRSEDNAKVSSSEHGDAADQSIDMKGVANKIVVRDENKNESSINAHMEDVDENTGTSHAIIAMEK